MTDIIKVDSCHKLHLLIHDRKDMILAVADLNGHISQRHIRIKNLVVMLNDTVHTHKSKNRLISMMCKQLASLSKTHGIDAMRLKGLYS